MPSSRQQIAEYQQVANFLMKVNIRILTNYVYQIAPENLFVERFQHISDIASNQKYIDNV